MTQTATPALVPATQTMSQQVSRRLRGTLAENRISQTDLARVLHMPQQKISRKVNGQTPFTVDELALLSEALDVELDRLMGIGAYEDRPIGLCAIRDSNPEPADSTPRLAVLRWAQGPGDFATVPPAEPGRNAFRHLELVRSVGGAA